ncbi:B3 domain-containing protein REM19-like [Cajanus cajan]|nr:B3 domain-containing protein REM19-like [Cajanus cajan]
MRDEKPSQRASSLNRPIQTRAREVASSFISINPFFTVFLKPAHVLESYLAVPDMKGIFEKKEKYVHVKLQLGERSWNVKLLLSQRFSFGRLSAGWSLFASENELQPGDVCVFELISRDDPVFKVHVFKRQD